MNKMPEPGEIYQHFKGNLYRIVTLAEHTEDGEQLVVYQALYGDFKVFARPLDMFVSKVDHDKYPDVKAEYRFTLVPAVGGALPGSPADGGNRTDKIASAQRLTSEPQADSPAKEAESRPEEEFELNPRLLAFLEADSYEKKLEIYASLAGRTDESMLNTIAVSLDLELSGDTLEEQYETLKNCLLMLEKYECNRLR
ncbi:MAG: DUF1653 domain-containing protein [Eubacteriales bacterium]|nr:DUF1653 domain-containing protein [Eubacteriales bacterium]